MLTLVFILIGCIGAAAVVVMIGTATKSKWGINLAPPPSCPSCGDAVDSQIRKPANLGEALWGGRTCGKCGTRIDKWGRVVGPVA